MRLVDAHIKVSGEYISHAMLGGLYRGLIYASHLPVRLPCCIDGPFAPNSLAGRPFHHTTPNSMQKGVSLNTNGVHPARSATLLSCTTQVIEVGWPDLTSGKWYVALKQRR